MQRSRPAVSRVNGPRQCAFCGYEITESPVQGRGADSFCTERCRDAHESGNEPFVDRHGFKQFVTGVSALDTLLPRGMPANSFVLLSGEGGIRHRGLQTELLWRALRRGEPAVVITYVDPPIAILEHFFAFGWNVLPYVEAGDLHLIDCYTNRLREEHRTPERQVEWNEFLGGFLEDSVTSVSDTTDLHAVESRLHTRLDEQEMLGTGLVIVDSLNEVEIQSGEHETEQFIKEVRGDVCSRKHVPMFASATGTSDGGFAQDHAYLFDGIVRMRRNESLLDGVALKQIGIRKMDGVLYRPHWAAYENTGRTGFQLFDPETEFVSTYGYQPPRSNGVSDGRRGQ